MATGGPISLFPTVYPLRVPDWSRFTNVTVSPDGSMVALSSESAAGVNVWDTKTGQLLYALPEQNGTVWWISWSPDSGRLAVSRSNGDIAIWNLEEAKQLLSSLEL